jgi:hypothetical protein
LPWLGLSENKELLQPSMAMAAAASLAVSIPTGGSVRGRGGKLSPGSASETGASRGTRRIQLDAAIVSHQTGDALIAPLSRSPSPDAYSHHHRFGMDPFAFDRDLASPRKLKNPLAKVATFLQREVPLQQQYVLSSLAG